MDNSLIVIILQVGVILASGFLIAYVRKKANNYADKKDLKELTAIVEKEKSKYATDLSVIKAQLDIVANNKKSYREKEVDAISEFYSVCNWLVYDFWNLDFAWFNTAHYKQISEISDNCFISLKKLTIAHGRFRLFIADVDLQMKGYRLQSVCITYCGKIQSFITSLKFSLEKQINLREDFQRYLQSREKDLEKEEKIVKEDEDIRKEVHSYKDEYIRLRKEYNDSVVIPTMVEFEDLVRIYLSKT
jgi:hypothetical protein